MRTYVRMRTVRVIVRDHQPGKPWIILATHEETVEVPENVPFWAAADEAWPRDTHSVEPAPGENIYG